jgi:hypothetical protein
MFKKLGRKTMTAQPRDGIDTRVFEFPKPGEEKVPIWFSTLPEFYGDHQKLRPNNSTIKQSLPLQDAFTTGFIFVTPYDMEIMNPGTTLPDVMVNDPNLKVEKVHTIAHTYGGPPIANKIPNDFAHSAPAPEGYTKADWQWNTGFDLATPEGYSFIYTHPLNRYELPFITSSGIFDGDKFGKMEGINFFVRNGWYGIIPKGTPYLQVIPFKREDWVLEPIAKDENKYKSAEHLVSTSWYKDTAWSPKSFTSKENYESPFKNKND